MNKSTETKTQYTGGIGFTGLLTIVFITLKLTGFISWSWWWVLSPIWISVIVAILIFTVVFGLIVWLDKR